MADTERQPPNDVPPANQDLEQLQELYDLMQEEHLESLELQDQDVRIRLQRARKSGLHEGSRASSSSPHAASTSDALPATDSPSSYQIIATPLAGVFYRASSPTTPAYVQEGSVVDQGQTLCIVEAMKVMNEIKAERRCRIVKILAENSRPVIASQALFQVEPA